MRVLAISHQRDAGPGVFAEAVAERRGELDVWHRAETDDPPADPLAYDAVMVFGGAMHPDQEAPYPWLSSEKALLRRIVEAQTPVLGLCLGAQLLAEACGGAARRASEPEIGWFSIELTEDGMDDPLIGSLKPSFEAFEWHSFEFEVPAGAIELARTPLCTQAFRFGRATYGLQFHAEVSTADVLHWIDDYRVDEDAVRIGLDPVALRAETERKIAAWNRFGYELCGRWLELARRPPAPA